MPPSIRIKAPTNANKTNKLHIAFDPDKRREHLTGFSKRKEERRRYGLAMGAMKAKKELLEERRERRQLEKESLEAQLGDNFDAAQQGPAVRAPQAPVTSTFADGHTLGMFGDVVSVSVTMDSLGQDEEEEDYAARHAAKRQRVADVLAQGGKAAPDEAQRQAYSFKTFKAQVDASQLSTKKSRKALRNKAQRTLDGKMGKAKGGGEGGGKGGKGGRAPGASAKDMVTKAVKRANFGKKKSRTNNAKKKGA
jgi:ribosomal RNA-processing protein 17